MLSGKYLDLFKTAVLTFHLLTICFVVRTLAFHIRCLERIEAHVQMQVVTYRPEVFRKPRCECIAIGDRVIVTLDLVRLQGLGHLLSRRRFHVMPVQIGTHPIDYFLPLRRVKLNASSQAWSVLPAGVFDTVACANPQTRV